MSSGRALVVGGGVIGVCSAYYLAGDGWDVTLVEKGEVCCGCSYGNAGLLVPSHSVPLAAPGVWLKGLRWMLDPESPFYIKPRPSLQLAAWLWRFRAACTEAHVRRAMPVIRDLSHASLALYRELAATDGLDFGFRQEGVLAVFRTAGGYREGVYEAELLESVGIPTRALDRAAVHDVEPGLAPEVVGGVLYPDDGQVVPDRFVRGLARAAEARGVRVREATEVLGFRTDATRIAAVETTRGDLEADLVVLAAGSWSPGLGRALGLRVPIEPAKGYSVTYRRRPEGPRIPLMLMEARVGVTPMGETLRLAGTLELAGLDLSIDRRRVNAIVRGARRYVRGLERLEVLEIWRGLRPCTPDGLPLIGRSERLENLIVATGHATIGVSLGPVTGKLVAQIAAGAPPTLDLSALRPERFS
jgi:D-amino-acid dehydrogenase